MRPLAFLKCLGKAALKQAANMVGFGLGNVVEDVWNEWNKERDAAQRQAELQAIVQMAGDQFRQQVEAVVHDVAAGQPDAVRRHVSDCLQQLPDHLRRSFRRPDDEQGRTVPPGLRLKQASDLAPFLSFRSPTPGAPQVTLEFTQGHQAGQKVVCTEPTVLFFGRAKDCQPPLPREGHQQVSRHHCLVECNPPDVSIRDLGSQNGTFVNGTLIGKRPKGEGPGGKFASKEHELKDGDEVRLTPKGQVVFNVRIVVPAPPKENAASVIKACSWCHREVAERGANRPGLFICSNCRANMQDMMKEMMGQAQAGDRELKVIRDYTLVEELGHGGMGAVYLARHNQTGKPAAIKLMLPKVAADDHAVTLFQREVRNTMALRHRHVVGLLDHGYARGTFFMVLEYCDGGSVDGLMEQRGGTLPVDEAVEITLQALEGLEYAHQAEIPFVKMKGGGYGPGKGLVHRDLKPANLFLTGWGSGRIVKVGDYGLAKAFDETGLSGGTRTGDVAGTWEFMCRQQAIAYKAPKPEVDVWAMAASLYNMLTGHVPRDFPADKDPWLVVLEEPAVPILKRNPKLPPRLAAVIDRALVEEPEMPFKTAAEFKLELERAVVDS